MTGLCWMTFLSSAGGAQFSFNPGASVSAQYTDNLFLTPDNEEDDIVTNVAIGFRAGIESRTASLFLSFFPSYVAYKENDDRNTWRLPATINGRWDVSKYTSMTLDNSFLRTEDPLPDQNADILKGDIPPASADTTVRRGREPYYRNRGRIALLHQFGPDDRFDLDYAYTVLRNDDDQRNQDSDGHRVTAGLLYWFTQRWGSEFRAAYTRGIFDPDNSFQGTPNSDFDSWTGFIRINRRFNPRVSAYVAYSQEYFDFDEETAADYQVYEPTVGVDYSVEQDLKFLASIGYNIREFENPQAQAIQEALDKGTGLTANLDLIKTLRQGSLRFNVGSGYTQSYFTNQNRGFTRFYLAGGSATYQIYKRISINGFAAYRRSEFEDTIPQRDDDIYRVGAGLGYGITRWMTIAGRYGYNRVDSNVSINSYSENRFTLSLEFSPAQPYLSSF